MSRIRPLTAVAVLVGTVLSSSFPAAASQLVFVTSSVQNGNFGGLAGGDAICNSLAQAAGRQGQFAAWLSNAGINGADRVPGNGPFILVDGTQIAADRAALLGGTLEAPISLTETGAAPISQGVWTGTNADGTKSGFTCNGWNAAGMSGGTLGLANSTTSTWSNSGVLGCDQNNRIFCFQFPQGTAAAPLFSDRAFQSLAVLLLALLGLSGLRRRVS